MKSEVAGKFQFLLLTPFQSLCGISNGTLYSSHYWAYGPKPVRLLAGEGSNRHANIDTKLRMLSQNMEQTCM